MIKTIPCELVTPRTASTEAPGQPPPQPSPHGESPGSPTVMSGTHRRIDRATRRAVGAATTRLRMIAIAARATRA
jgi:hypothetical protein